MSVNAIRDEVLSLPAQERAKLIDELWESLASEQMKMREALWAEESERRIDALDSGQLQARDAQSVLTDLRKDLRR